MLLSLSLSLSLFNKQTCSADTKTEKIKQLLLLLKQTLDDIKGEYFIIDLEADFLYFYILVDLIQVQIPLKWPILLCRLFEKNENKPKSGRGRPVQKTSFQLELK